MTGDTTRGNTPTPTVRSGWSAASNVTATLDHANGHCVSTLGWMVYTTRERRFTSPWEAGIDAPPSMHAASRASWYPWRLRLRHPRRCGPERAYLYLSGLRLVLLQLRL